MNIGIYVKTLQPSSPAATRFQESILEGLKKVETRGFRFIVFSENVPDDYIGNANIDYVALTQPTTAQINARKLKLFAGGVARRLLRFFGENKLYQRVADWLAYEPAYYQQLRDLNIRLMWNCGKDILPSFLPMVVVQWDANHRLHPMFPEFSESVGPFQWPEIEERMLRQASYVIVGTEQGKREVIAAFGTYPDKIRVVPLPVPTFPKPRVKSPVDRPYLYYPGRFKPHKNQIVVVHALKELRDRLGVELGCIFTGIDDGNLQYVLEEAGKIGVRDQIEYRGNVAIQEMSDLYTHATALVYCSAVGPDNFPPLEAMSLGCPVVAARVPGAEEQYGDAALLFERTNEYELAQCINRLIIDSELRQSMIAKGLIRAGKGTPMDYANAMLDIFEEFSQIARMWSRGDFKIAWN